MDGLMDGKNWLMDGLWWDRYIDSEKSQHKGNQKSYKKCSMFPPIGIDLQISKLCVGIITNRAKTLQFSDGTPTSWVLIQPVLSSSKGSGLNGTLNC